MGVVNHAEMGLGLFAGGGERIDGGIFFVADDFHVVATAVMNAVCANLIKIRGVGFQAREAHLKHFVVDVTQAVSAAFNFPGIGQVRFFSYEDISVCECINCKGNPHGSFRVVFKQRGGRYEFP